MQTKPETARELLLRCRDEVEARLEVCEAAGPAPFSAEPGSLLSAERPDAWSVWDGTDLFVYETSSTPQGKREAEFAVASRNQRPHELRIIAAQLVLVGQWLGCEYCDYSGCVNGGGYELDAADCPHCEHDERLHTAAEQLLQNISAGLFPQEGKSDD